MIENKDSVGWCHNIFRYSMDFTFNWHFNEHVLMNENANIKLKHTKVFIEQIMQAPNIDGY